MQDTTKPLFDFTKKYTKRSIAEFLLKNGVHKTMYQYRPLDTPEKVENEVIYMCKDKLCFLEHKAKLYNSSILFGGQGNWDQWEKAECNTAYTLVMKHSTEQIVFPQLGITASELNEAIKQHRDVLYNSNEGFEEMLKFTKAIEPFLNGLQKIYKDYEESVIGCHIGTKEEALELFELLKPTYTEYINTLKSDAKFMQFLEEKKAKALENKE